MIFHSVSAEDVEFEEVFASAPALEEFEDSVAEVDESLPQETGAEAEDLLALEEVGSEAEIPYIDLTTDGEEQLPDSRRVEIGMAFRRHAG